MPSPLSTALACRCPRCGEGALFEGFITVRARCDHCGLDLSDHDTGDGPAVFLIFILGALCVPLALWINAAFDVAFWVPAVVAGAVALGLTFALLRPSKAYIIALNYRHRSGSSGDSGGGMAPPAA